MLPRLIFFHLLGAWLLLSFFPGELRAQGIDDRPMKLCGREFVRAVIFVCGESRWRRFPMVQMPLPQEQEPEQMFVSQDNDVENGKLDPEVIPGRKEEQIPLSKRGWDLLKNMLNPHGHTEDSAHRMEEFIIGSDESKEAVEKNKSEIKATSPLEQYDFMLGTHLRKKRDRSTSIADRCCHESCTRKDIARLC
ncbi:prorelaxin H2-like [Trichosurus vulpecula]|uniref:prorelaxin H2-like n=1 Tax=Trichosurus vulpecula TaxID=9337 RepID=UPI00186AE615|nr:prorelaxin H2-like [Trichosurus vulpecula]